MKKILLIEDDEIKAKDVSEFIQKNCLGIVEQKDSITSGLRALKNNEYDYVLLDMSLPRFSGDSSIFEPFGGIDIIKELERKKKVVPIIVITQYSIFGEGALTKTLEEIKQECQEYEVDFKDVIKYSRDDASWKIELKKYI